MSTQVLDKETVHETELTAEAVKSALDRREATRDYRFTITIFEKFGRAFISWQLDPNYAIGPRDVVQVREGDRWVRDWERPVTGASGEVDMGRSWGSNLTASYWALDRSGVWRQLVVTSPT